MKRADDMAPGTRNTERDLLQRCSAGDTAAYEGIVAIYRDRAYYYALSMLHNHDDALDSAQAAFAKAFRALDSFDPDRRFLPWFMRILHNHCATFLCRRKRRSEVSEADAPPEHLRAATDPAPGPSAAVERQERLAAVHAALGQLPGEHRQVLVLRHFDELTYAQIAEALDIPQGTVMSRLYNGRRKLAALLRAER